VTTFSSKETARGGGTQGFKGLPPSPRKKNPKVFFKKKNKNLPQIFNFFLSFGESIIIF
jgi:hypothetical protein